MAPNPIPYSEIEAFGRLEAVRFAAWEVDLICRLDDAALATLGADTKRARPSSKPAATQAIPVSNTAGIKSLFLGIQAEKAARAEARTQGGRNVRSRSPGPGI